MPLESSDSKTHVELQGERVVLIRRSFKGPARIVFEAWTRPELVKRWWAPKSMGVEVEDIQADVRVGGRYRYVIRPRDQAALAFSGEYREVTPHSRLVYTQVFEPMADAGEVLCTITFEEQEGATLMTAHEEYPSAEARAGAVASGMADGMRITLEQLDELVVSLS